MFIAGGYDGHKFMTECEKYDPVKNEWTKVCLVTKKNTKKLYFILYDFIN